MCGCAHIHYTACARTRRGYLYATDESVSERRTISQTFTAVDLIGGASEINIQDS